MPTWLEKQAAVGSKIAALRFGVKPPANPLAIGGKGVGANPITRAAVSETATKGLVEKTLEHAKFNPGDTAPIIKGAPAPPSVPAAAAPAPTPRSA